tara:strand:- start:4664 stop:5590 length:927 start_codon:yes stop_codon:yes gene_type:complete
MKKKGNILIPVFNESSGINEFCSLVLDAIPTKKYNFTITLVDDGSVDDSWKIIETLKSTEATFRKIKLSRNFGHQGAIFAGLENNEEDFVIVIDADFQDDPKYINDLIREWEVGYKVVLARKIRRKGEFLKKIYTKIYFRIQNKFTQFTIPRDVGHYSLIDSSIVQKLSDLPEVNKFLIGLRAFMGSEVTYIDVVKNERKYGSSKMSFRQLFNLSIDGILSFSTLPLNLIGGVGIVLSITTIFYTLFGLLNSLLSNGKLAQINLTLAILLFISGIQLFSLSVVGQYVSKIFYETKKRPAFLIEKKIID